MMPILPLFLAACGIENNIETCPEEGCYPVEEDTATDGSDATPNSDHPSYGGCDFTAFALPIAEDSSSSLVNVCPLNYQGPQSGEYDAACEATLNTNITNIEDATVGLNSYFLGDVSLFDILACKVPVTIFYEYAPTFAEAGDTGIDPEYKMQETKLYVTLGDERAAIAPYERGDYTEPLPFPNFFFKTSIEYVDGVTVTRSDVTHGVADADLPPLTEETNVIEFDYDGVEARNMLVNGLVYATPCEACDYTLVTSGTHLKSLDEDLTETVMNLLQIDADETETLRGGKYFPPEN